LPFSVAAVAVKTTGSPFSCQSEPAKPASMAVYPARTVPAALRVSPAPSVTSAVTV